MARLKSGLYPNALATIRRQLEAPVQAAAEAYADRLRENVSQTSGGRGTHHSGLPNRSSAPGQYPVKQSGSLAESVDARATTDRLVHQVGFFGEDSKKLLALEFGSRDMSERAPLARTAQDNDTREVMLKAAKSVSRR